MLGKRSDNQATKSTTHMPSNNDIDIFRDRTYL